MISSPYKDTANTKRKTILRGGRREGRLHVPGTPPGTPPARPLARPPEPRGAGEVVGPSPARPSLCFSVFLSHSFSLSTKISRAEDRQNRQHGGGCAKGRQLGLPRHAPGTPAARPRHVPLSLSHSPRIEWKTNGKRTGRGVAKRRQPGRPPARPGTRVPARPPRHGGAGDLGPSAARPLSFSLQRESGKQTETTKRRGGGVKGRLAPPWHAPGTPPARPRHAPGTPVPPLARSQHSSPFSLS